MKEFFHIVRPRYVRDERMERNLIEHNREQLLYGMLVAGAVLMLVAISW